MKIALIIATAVLSASCYARTYDFKMVSSKGASDNNFFIFQNRDKRLFANLKIGSATKADDVSPLNINVATVFRDVSTKKAFVNDVQFEMFTPTNTRPIVFTIASGVARYTKDTWANVAGDWSSGFRVAGFIVEIFQNGKVIKHLTNVPGADGEVSICDNGIDPKYIEADGYPCEDGIGFKNKTKIQIQR